MIVLYLGHLITPASMLLLGNSEEVRVQLHPHSVTGRQLRLIRRNVDSTCASMQHSQCTASEQDENMNISRIHTCTCTQQVILHCNTHKLYPS